MATAIDWSAGGFDAAAAFSAAENRPLFLYWGAAWCPPCNRSKSDLFARADFAALVNAAVPVFLDGDSGGAQQLAARLKLRSYPTLVLYRPDGQEVMRLPCEPDGEVGIDIVKLALAAQYTAAESLHAALSGTRALQADEWRVLSYYSWDTDEGQLLGQRALSDTLAELVSLCPPGNAAQRLLLQTMSVGAGAPDADALLRILGDVGLARANMDLLCNNGLKLIKFAAVPGSAMHGALVAALYAAAGIFADDIWLTTPDRMAALRLQVRLLRSGVADAGLPDRLPRLVAELGQQTDDPQQRHALVNAAAGAFSDAGLLDASDALLNAELGRSHAPFYFMHNLAANARRRGDAAAVLDWQQQAWQEATGPATRLQWGATYFLSLVELAPSAHARIEQAAAG
ncbi:thioredoxin family protein, partial [Janthinobacterium agaricidamnosum]